MAEEKQYKDIRLKSDEVNEILGKPPKFIFRMGNSIVFILLIVFFVISTVIKYPTSLTGQATIKKTSTNSYIVTGIIPVNNAASLKVNQSAVIVLNAYPQSFYGKLVGRVAKIYPFDSPSSVTFEVKLDRALTTNIGKTITLQPILTGQVSVIVKNNSVLQNLLPF